MALDISTVAAHDPMDSKLRNPCDEKRHEPEKQAHASRDFDDASPLKRSQGHV